MLSCASYKMEIATINIVLVLITTGNFIIILISSRPQNARTSMIASTHSVLNSIFQIIEFNLKPTHTLSIFQNSFALISILLKPFLAKNNVLFFLTIEKHDRNFCLFYHNPQDCRRPNFKDYGHIQCKKDTEDPCLETDCPYSHNKI